LPSWNHILQELTSYSDEEVLVIEIAQQTPLRELSYNMERTDKDKDKFPLEQLKVGVIPRKKYEYTPSTLHNTTRPNDKTERPLGERPLLEKYCSISKANNSSK
jgi:hypothetical protein